jgi:3',5'-cyclic-AMP phosphodiesterase
MLDILKLQVSRCKFPVLGLGVPTEVSMLTRRWTESGENPNPGGRKKATRWAFLSDTHIAASPLHRFRGHYPYQNLRAVLDQVAGDMPDGVVITGDLARRRGDAGAYENFRALLAPIAATRPVHLGLGNHDHRERFLSSLGAPGSERRAVGRKQIIRTTAGPLRLIVLDSLLYTNLPAGMIGKTQCHWLDAYLRTCDDTPTILFLHHAPRADLLDVGRLLDIAAPARKVKAIVYGHSHRYRFREYEGIHLVNLPATGYNFTSAQPEPPTHGFSVRRAHSTSTSHTATYETPGCQWGAWWGASCAEPHISGPRLGSVG